MTELVDSDAIVDTGIDPDAGSDSAPATRSQRRPAKVTREMVAPLASTEPLTVEAMILRHDGQGASYFRRLKYKGCPPLTKRGEYNPTTDYMDMCRDDFVREMYRLFKPNYNTSRTSYFHALTKYIRWLDNNELEPIDDDYFHNELTYKYMQYYGAQVNLGLRRKGSWRVARTALGFILKAQGRSVEYTQLPSPRNDRSDCLPHKGLNVERELKPAVRALYRGYYGLLKHLNDGTTPEINPLWDEALFEAKALSCEWSTRKKGRVTMAFKHSVIKGEWRNQLSRIAIMICYMFTGMNAKPMMMMKRSDVAFKRAQQGKYIFETTKGRANYLKIDNQIGFSRHAKRFIDSWLSASAKITKTDDGDYLFPYINTEGEIISHWEAGGAPQGPVNILLAHLGLSGLTSSSLRKTKTATLVKVTEDLYLVSRSANNDIRTTIATYSLGSEEDNESSWAAAGQAQYDIAKGKDVGTAVSEAKFSYKDPLSEYDYKKRLRPKSEALTPLGVRCQDNTKGAAKLIDQAFKKSGIEKPESEALCIDFLGCFDCESHKLVAAVDDIWLMLSFRDTLNEMLQYPSINSLPKSRHSKMCFTIDAILVRFKEVDEVNFKQAQEQHKSASHPLYATLYSLSDLLEVFS